MGAATDPSAAGQFSIGLGALPAELAFVAARVVNLAHRPVPDFNVYVGRTFAGRRDVGFGNPIRLRLEGEQERASVLVRYWKWLNGDDPRAVAVRRRIRAGELTDKVLACWCAGKGLCHGHVLAALAAGATTEVHSFVAALERALESRPAERSPLTSS